MAKLTLEWSWGAYLAAIYVVGATANHSLFLAIHELSHNLGFRNVSYNKMLAMVANLPIGIPYCITFKPFHMEHHRYQVQNLLRVRALSVRERSDSALFTPALAHFFLVAHAILAHAIIPYNSARVARTTGDFRDMRVCNVRFCKKPLEPQKSKVHLQNHASPSFMSCGTLLPIDGLDGLWLDGGQRGVGKNAGVQILQKNINQFFCTFGMTLPIFSDSCWLFMRRTTPGLDFAKLKIWSRKKREEGI